MFEFLIADAAKALRHREISAVELTEQALQQIAAADASLGSFITLMADSAIKAATRADASFRVGRISSDVQGIPIAVKDNIDTRDAPTTAGSRVRDGSWGKGDDAEAVARLRQGGAVIIGKTNLDEFGCGAPDPSSGFPVTRNPWDTARSPGGSSSGSACSVARGLVLGALGTDTGGSIRGPAAYCGVSGLKPTFGLVSTEGCVPLGYSVDHVGPIARTAEDCAILLNVIAAPRQGDPKAPPGVPYEVPPGDTQALTGLRIGLPLRYFFDLPTLKPEIRTAVLEAIDQLAAHGAQVREVEIPHAVEARIARAVIMVVEAYAYHEPYFLAASHLYTQYARDTLGEGAKFTGADYVAAQRVRTLVKQECWDATRNVDVLVMPTMVDTAPYLAGGHQPIFAYPDLVGIWNLAGFPALSVPCGFSAAGLPIGMQIVARPFEDGLVLRTGAAYQSITRWHTRRPPRNGLHIPADSQHRTEIAATPNTGDVARMLRLPEIQDVEPGVTFNVAGSG
jgi:aspartyl-tRNA(Asn)/glutamyl-tRNA(Gln) amidotransferase subunit A